MNNVALVINTVSKNSDVWEMFFGELNEHFPPQFKKYVFVDEASEGIPDDCEVILYDKAKKYQEQFASCISSVKEEYCIYISEDYILYSPINYQLIEELYGVLDVHPGLSFIRFMRGGVVDFLHEYKNYNTIYKLYNYLPYFYTNQAALWRTRDLEEIHVQGPALHIGNEDYENSFEFQATKTCEKLGIEGAFYHNNEPKRGLYHYDTEIFPHVSTALVKGKWNISEYKKELVPLLEKYDIDVSARGSV